MGQSHGHARAACSGFRRLVFAAKTRYVGRGERIRTSDPLHPMQVRYQAALRPVDQANKYSRLFETQERSEREQLTAQIVLHRNRGNIWLPARYAGRGCV